MGRREYRRRAMKRAKEARNVYLARDMKEGERMELDKDEAKLYVCACEYQSSYSEQSHRYYVHAIKLSDLFSSPSSPDDLQQVAALEVNDLPMFSSQYSDLLLQQVDVLEGHDLPINMGIGVFGSRIVLAGGILPFGGELHPRTYVLETDKTVEPSPRFVSSKRKPTRPPYVIPGLPGGQKNCPWLGEIDGKLYALSGPEFGRESPAFFVYNPKTGVWASLPSFSTGEFSWNAIRESNVAVVGTKIFVTLRTWEGKEGKLLCFDVAKPKAKWSDFTPRIRDTMGVFPKIYNKVLVVDSGKKDEKLLFTFDYKKILVSRMVLSAKGETDCIERVAKIHLFGPLNGFMGTSYSCVHLGGQQVCFAFFWGINLLVLTFKYSYSKSAASPPLLGSDSEFLTCESISGSFSVQTLGFRLFKYQTSQLQDVGLLDMMGCFVL